jgi:hypothetical protein
MGATGIGEAMAAIASSPDGGCCAVFVESPTQASSGLWATENTERLVDDNRGDADRLVVGY